MINRGYEQPADYTLDYERTIVGPGEIYADKDSFNFKFDILNLGRGMNEVVEVQVLQTGPASDTVYKKTFFFPAPLNKESYTIQIPIKGDIAGKNKLFVEIDPRNTVVEITDANNILKDNAGNTGIEFVILSNEVFPTFPKMFSIYNGEKPLELITSSVNSFAPNGRYKMQLDTSELFNTSDLKETVFESTSTFMVWKPNVELIPNKVYYWRVCKIDEESQRAAWV
ncbi:MAG: hypothetical protein IPN72_18825 [Saprospiraceae bacterium]|nr:hypothetical protein [Saprospiraceae bacterium]